MSRPLRSTPITGASPLLRAGPPASAASVLNVPRFPPHDALPLTHLHLNAGKHYRHSPSHVPCRRCRPDSRRLHAGHHLANRRAPARLIPELRSHPGFDVVWFPFDTSAAIHLRSSSRTPPDASYDAFSSSLTTTVFSQRSMRRFEASPRRATSKGHTLHHPYSTTSRSCSYINFLSVFRTQDLGKQTSGRSRRCSSTQFRPVRAR